MIPVIQISSDFYELPATQRVDILTRLRDWCNVQLFDKLIIQGTIDSMKKALDVHGHVWTRDEKEMRDTAISLLRGDVKVRV